MPPNKNQREKLKEWFELADNAEHCRPHVIECRGQVDERAIDLREAYLRSDFEFHAHISLGVGGCEPVSLDYCAQFHRSLQRFFGSEVFDGQFFTRNNSAHSPRDQHDWRNNLVFIIVGQLSEDGEGVDEREARSVASVVRLVPLDECPVARLNLVERITALEEGGSIRDRESDTLGLLWQFPLSVEEGKLPRQVVQSAPKVVL